jgi:hypothetical protein
VWKLTKAQYSDRLDTELTRMKVRAASLTLNEQGSRDPSAALYFTRPPAADDFSCAIAMTLNFLRRLDEIGATDIINRAYSGFRAELTEGVTVG